MNFSSSGTFLTLGMNELVIVLQMFVFQLELVWYHHQIQYSHACASSFFFSLQD